MKIFSLAKAVGLMTLCAFGLTCAQGWAKDNNPSDASCKVDEAIVLLQDLKKDPDNSIPEKLLDKCYGIALFPSVVKAGLIVGGMFGKGLMLAKIPETGKWSPPVFISIGGASVGFQFGAAAVQMVLVIMNEQGVSSLAHTNVTLGGDLGVAAGPVGRNAAISGALTAAILSYSRSQGAFAGIALNGAIITPLNDVNKEIYGDDVTVNDILAGNVKMTPAARKLIKAIENYDTDKK